MDSESLRARELVPDDTVLAAIFATSQPSSIEILANNWDVCTFRAKLENDSHPTFPDDLIVRLETAVGNLKVVTALQNVAALEISELVPKVYAVGKTVTRSGKNIELTVIQYVADTEVLDSI